MAPDMSRSESVATVQGTGKARPVVAAVSCLTDHGRYVTWLKDWHPSGDVVPTAGIHPPGLPFDSTWPAPDSWALRHSDTPAPRYRAARHAAGHPLRPAPRLWRVPVAPAATGTPCAWLVR
ncbi:hypothetical protein GCM10010499_34710 [Streptomyces thermoviolaceus subsp. apingens]|nr:hypothetical protein GCM10010499_34710 [Streptomyces thermoviolaceus subsp. apingens]